MAHLLKKSSGQRANFQPGAGASFALLAAVLIFAGCGKAPKPAAQTRATPPESASPAAADNSQPSPTTPATAAAVTATNREPDLKELDRGLLRWILKNRRRPANFEDFAATAGVDIPPPPAGKKYVLAKNMHIQLVSE